MYPNLNAEMGRLFMSGLALANLTGIPYSTLSPKLAGRTPLKLSEAIAIKRALKVDIPLETLFEEKEGDFGAELDGME